MPSPSWLNLRSWCRPVVQVPPSKVFHKDASPIHYKSMVQRWLRAPVFDSECHCPLCGDGNLDPHVPRIPAPRSVPIHLISPWCTGALLLKNCQLSIDKSATEDFDQCRQTCLFKSSIRISLPLVWGSCSAVRVFFGGTARGSCQVINSCSSKPTNVPS